MFNKTLSAGISTFENLVHERCCAQRWSSKLNLHYGVNSRGIVCFNKVDPVMKECSFLNGSYAPALTAYEYRGYLISAWARPEFTNGSTSVGIVYKQNQLGSIIQVQRIEGELFENKELAEQHGVKLCTEWIDNQRGRV